MDKGEKATLHLLPYSQKYSGSTWEYYGSIWEYHGSIMGVRWEYDGSTVGVRWEYCGSTVGVLWKYCGSVNTRTFAFSPLGAAHTTFTVVFL